MKSTFFKDDVCVGVSNLFNRKMFINNRVKLEGKSQNVFYISFFSNLMICPALPVPCCYFYKGVYCFICYVSLSHHHRSIIRNVTFSISSIICPAIITL